MDAPEAPLPWRWIFEHLVDMKDIGTPILREMMTFIPDIALYSSLQKRVALRYLEEAIAAGKIDAQVIPLMEALLKESQRTSTYPTSSDYSDLLLRVQLEAVIMHIRGKPIDWHGFSQALDHFFPEDAKDAQFLEKRKELATLLQIQGQEEKRVEILEIHPLTALRHDLLKCITSEKARLERTFLDKLLQDVYKGKYPLPAGLVGKPVLEKKDSQEDFHSVDVQRNSIGSDDQTVIGGRNSNAESEEAVEIKHEESAATQTAKSDPSAAVDRVRKRGGSKKPSRGNRPAKKPCHVDINADPEERSKSLGGSSRPEQGLLNLRQRDQHGKAVTSNSPLKSVQDLNLRSHPDDEIALDVKEDSLHVEFLEMGSDGHEEFCHKCREGGRLICCDGCPIAVHRRCLGSDSSVLIEEEWFCPLCVQKKATETVARAREEEMAARQRAAQFMADANAKKAHEKLNHSPSASHRMPEQNRGKKAVADGKKNVVDGELDAVATGFENWTFTLDAHMPKEKKATKSTSGGHEKKIMVPRKENSFKTPVSPSEACCDTTDVGIPLIPSKVDDLDYHPEKARMKGKRSEGLKRQDGTCNESAEKVVKLPTEPHDAGIESTPSRHTNTASSSKAKHVDQFQNHTDQAEIQVQVADGDGHDGDLEEDSEGRNSGRVNPKREQRLKLRGNRIIPGMRRKRLHWSKEEEDILTEGVKKFSRGNGAWGFQWTRILEYGRGKFHPSRTDVDLKDKWRNLAKTMA